MSHFDGNNMLWGMIRIIRLLLCNWIIDTNAMRYFSYIEHNTITMSIVFFSHMLFVYSQHFWCLISWVCDSDESKWMPRWSFSSVNAIAMDCVCSNKLDGTFSSINLATSNVRCSSQIVRAQFDVDASCHKCCVDERFCLLLILITMMWRYMGA